jgi:hypothetical protein
MKFGLYGLHRGSSVEPEALARRARLAEDAGFESLWVGDHIAVPGDDPDDDDRLEAVTALSYLAAVTTGVRLCAGVLVLPQRHPVLLAKQLASVDRLSCGRLTVGIGVGHIEAELNALGVTLAGRGARTDEYLAAMRTLWTGQASSYAGEWVQFTSVVERPRLCSSHTHRSSSADTRARLSDARTAPPLDGSAGISASTRQRGTSTGCTAWVASAGRAASRALRSPCYPPANSTARR